MNQASQQDEIPFATARVCPAPSWTDPCQKTEQSVALDLDADQREANSAASQLHNARNLICYLQVVVDEILQQSRNLQAGPMQEVRTIGGTGSIEFEGLLERIKINHSQMDCLLETLQTTVQDLTLVVQQDPIGQADHQRTDAFKIDELTSDLIDRCIFRLAKKNIEISKIGSPNQIVTSDRNLLNQVLTNLITNAEDALSQIVQDEKRISIEWKSKDGWIEISVRDNGHGIPETITTRVLDLGYSTKAQGDGIGLTFCSKTMQQLHGYLEIAEPDSHSGTVVTLYLPCVEN